MTQQSLFERMGGQPTIEKLVARFYDHMDSLEEAKEVRELHPTDLKEAREKLYEFLMGWSGGPPLYMDKYGHPRLRMRHLPFPIGERERDQWMLCMQNALSEVVEEKALRDKLYGSFYQIADFMRNTDDS